MPHLHVQSWVAAPQQAQRCAHPVTVLVQASGSSDTVTLKRVAVRIITHANLRTVNPGGTRELLCNFHEPAKSIETSEPQVEVDSHSHLSHLPLKGMPCGEEQKLSSTSPASRAQARSLKDPKGYSSAMEHIIYKILRHPNFPAGQHGM